VKNKIREAMMRNGRCHRIVLFYAFVFLFAVFTADLDCFAVNSKITRHNSGAELLKGEVEDVVVSSKGTIQLGRSAEALVSEFEDINEPWSINCIVATGPAIYFGTSPNGGIYKYSLGKLERIYPIENGDKPNARKDRSEAESPEEAKKSDDANDKDVEKGEVVEAEEHLTNEHIFAMATDLSGRLLAGISGRGCRLIRFSAGKMETIFEPDDAKYIFSITTDAKGNIYLGTGPKGKVYMLDSFGKDAQVIYESKDKNILALTADSDGFVYAGGDGRGLIYKINPRTKTASVLYDSDEPEITALLLTEAMELYAAATSAKVVQTQAKFVTQLSLAAGRPEETSDDEEEENKTSGTSTKLQTANSRKASDEKQAKRPSVIPKGAKPGTVSYIYKITGAGYVKEEFRAVAVLFCLAEQPAASPRGGQGQLFVGTGNDAQLFSIEPATEQQAIVYEDKKASQITAAAVYGDEVYLGTANPAKLIKLSKRFAAEGTYSSDLVDAGQPARWGKLQIEAEIPSGCKVMASCRSGNVKDVNDPSFSEWSTPVEVKEPIELDCPVGRFCQYKLVLQSPDGSESPVIREIAVASMVPNLAPKIESVEASRLEGAGKEGVFKIEYKAEDENDDKLVYKIDFRKIGRSNWIEIEDETEAANFEWDSKTVEDGRYEIRVTASDEKSNTSTTKLSGSRVSDPVVVDNTAPVISKADVKAQRTKVTLGLTVTDEFTVIGQVQYTVDSNTDWTGTMPEDLVYDTMEEEFVILIEDLEAGEHIISVKVSDDVGNTAYKTYEVKIGS